jgi:hypothetical protein
MVRRLRRFSTNAIRRRCVAMIRRMAFYAGREAAPVELAPGAGFGAVVLGKNKYMKKLIFKTLFTVVLLAGTAAVATAQMTRVFYDNKGRVRYTIDYYGEKDMPRTVRSIVKPVYYDYTIVAVQEVKLNGRSIYMIELQDSNALKTIRVADGEMEEVRTLSRFAADDRAQKASTAHN